MAFDINTLILTLSPRPKVDDIPKLVKEHDIFLTLLMDKENPGEIGQAVEKFGGQW
jgi:hypothetical protein